MYTNHFGLIQHPFSLTPNTRYFLKLPAHQAAFEQLLEALQSDDQFAVISGEVGTGKTLLCRKVLFALEAYQECYVTAYIPNPVLSEQDVLHEIAEELQLQHDDSLSYKELIRLVSNALIVEQKNNRKVVLFIDEAQAMPEEALSALYLLTTLSEQESNLQIVLLGQPELIELLELPSLRQLHRDISFHYTLPPLTRDCTQTYIEFRLTKAGYNGSQLFTPSAIDAIFRASQGIPRVINILCHKAMMVAFGLGDQSIDSHHVVRAVNDTDSIEREKSLKQRLFGL